MSLAGLQINPIHSSGSANSLQHLADTGCIYCGESQEERGERLMEITPPCKCSFSIHLSCWEAQETRVCPSCKKVVIPKHILPSLEEVKEVGINKTTAIWIGLVVAVGLAFAIGLAVSLMGKN
jgi:hypothetical protein